MHELFSDNIHFATPSWLVFLSIHKKTEGPRANNGCASAFFNTRLSKSGDLMAWCHNSKGSVTPTRLQLRKLTALKQKKTEERA